MSLVGDLISGGWLKTERIIEAFKAIQRKDFLPEGMENLADLDQALPIGYGQTISQPLVVAFMIELLDPRPGEKILDIGSGSGWTSALLAYIVNGGEQKLKEGGQVIAIEIIPELKEFGEKNVSKYNFVKRGIVKFVCRDGTKGYESEAPFDKILASAAVYPRDRFISDEEKEIPNAWRKQLKIGGKIVVPIRNSIWLFTKESEEEFKKNEYPGFIFVPLINKNSL